MDIKSEHTLKADHNQADLGSTCKGEDASGCILLMNCGSSCSGLSKRNLFFVPILLQESQRISAIWIMSRLLSD